MQLWMVILGDSTGYCAGAGAFAGACYYCGARFGAGASACAGQLWLPKMQVPVHVPVILYVPVLAGYLQLHNVTMSMPVSL